jgi:hypothetical protein
MHTDPMPLLQFGRVSLFRLDAPTPANQVGERGQHLTTSFPEISEILDHAYESMEPF